MSILMPLWVLAGRAVFGVPLGWAFLALLMALPLMYSILAGTTVLALIQAQLQGRQQPRLSALQAWLHVLFWISLGLLGVTILDCYSEDCDVEYYPQNRYSVLTRLFGWIPGVVHLSRWLMYFFLAMSMLLWLALAIVLAVGVIAAWRHRRRSNLEDAPAQPTEGGDLSATTDLAENVERQLAPRGTNTEGTRGVHPGTDRGAVHVAAEEREPSPTRKRWRLIPIVVVAGVLAVAMAAVSATLETLPT